MLTKVLLYVKKKNHKKIQIITFYDILLLTELFLPVIMHYPSRREFMPQEMGRYVNYKLNGDSSEESFDIASLECEVLTKLFKETTSYMQNIRIEMVANEKGHRSKEEHPAKTISLTRQTATIQFVDWLDREERIEVIAHELAHLLLVYRYGLGVIGRKTPRHGNGEDVFKYFMSMTGDWVYLLGQIANTAHHLILIDYLKEEYGIEDNLHLYLLDQNFRVAASENARDKESQYGMGLVGFEYERLVGTMDVAINVHHQSEFFWQAYHSAQKHFTEYSSECIPARPRYEESILSFLETLGYQKEDFIFYPSM
jgi:hypothetical protein